MIAFYVIKQYERAVVFKLGKVTGEARGPGLILIMPFVERIHRVSLRIVTLPIQSQGIITKDNVSIDVSAVAYYRVEDPVRSVVAIENVQSAIGQIAQTTLRAAVGRHTLDETLSETDAINQNIREILDVQTEEWGVKVTVVELRDIQLPESMQRRGRQELDRRLPRPAHEHDRRGRRVPRARDQSRPRASHPRGNDRFYERRADTA
ncbi:MAG: SPFH domain-containing protein [Solirubrobacteraceae bacterium]